ncbi:MAG: hypothetical protein WAX67_12165 [Rugosibacter sp.]
MHADAQNEFLNAEIFSMTLAATAQRSRLYAPNLSEDDRKPFQKSLKAALESIASGYKKAVSEDQHVQNITDLAAKLTHKHPALLDGGKMKFGHAQKALNLYLKYLWCLGKLPMPPHCPIDSIILKKIPKFTQERWTQLDSAERYKSIIASAKAKAKEKGLLLAAWELNEYNANAT